MLRLKNIYKVYEAGELKQTALNGVSLNFRKSEFVAILGHSGSGKTTLLNIVGGLDRYTEGDLVINGKSTKEYKDRDWDTYRNHSIGFVFQSYNLIPHQTVLSNVELALTLSGVSKSERKQRAIEALEKVGLKDHIYKKPNQMSGGQMQRVAIARALINNPDILLADEPTGALDTDTSVQIMELLKEIAKDRLIIMVTHNPELANDYANRVIKLRDGNIVDDSNPLSDEDVENVTNNEKVKRTSMSFFTALSLSLNNLRTKKGRTFMTAFAGSIGIIGIALILSLSSGIKGYINKVQEDTLSSYPIMIESQTVDYSGMMEAMMGTNESEHENDKVYSNNIMTTMMKAMSAQITSNDLKSFKEYIESDDCDIDEYINDIKYGYNLSLQVYSNKEDEVLQVNPSTLFDSFMMGGSSASAQGAGTDASGMAGASSSATGTDAQSSAGATSGASSMASVSTSSMATMNTSVFSQMLDNEELLKSQYSILSGKWPEKYNELVLVVDKNNEVSDSVLYTLGLMDSSELVDLFVKIMAKEEITEDTEQVSFTYDEILNTEFKLVLNTDYYEKQGNIWVDKRADKDYLSEIVKNGETLKIVGIVKPDEEAVAASSIGGAIGYLSSLTEHVINSINEEEIVKEQKANEKVDIFTGKTFLEEQAAHTIESTMMTYENNLTSLGVVDMDNPAYIYIYSKDFDSKELVEKIIEDYNNDKIASDKEEYVVKYTDYVGLMMSSVTTIVDVISYVLIAFVGISLVVSSIMIGIITYISVLERTKEIGILRSIGASKKDISRVFNAETLIIGFVAGFIGIVVTIVLNIPISMIIKELVGISNIAKLPPAGGVILVIISMTLTLIAGLIPAKTASKKDPVVALRSE